jgi:hypothetical protein
MHNAVNNNPHCTQAQTQTQMHNQQQRQRQPQSQSVTIINVPCVRILIPTAIVNGAVQYQAANIPLSQLNQITQFSGVPNGIAPQQYSNHANFQNFPTFHNQTLQPVQNFYGLQNMNLQSLQQLQALAALSAMANMQSAALSTPMQATPVQTPMQAPAQTPVQVMQRPTLAAFQQTTGARSNFMSNNTIFTPTPRSPILAPIDTAADEIQGCEDDETSDEEDENGSSVSNSCHSTPPSSPNLNPNANVFDPSDIVPGATDIAAPAGPESASASTDNGITGETRELASKLDTIFEEDADEDDDDEEGESGELQIAIAHEIGESEDGNSSVDSHNSHHSSHHSQTSAVAGCATPAEEDEDSKRSELNGDDVEVNRQPRNTLNSYGETDSSSSSECEEVEVTIIDAEEECDPATQATLKQLMLILNKLNAQNYQLLSRNVKLLLTDENRKKVLLKIMEVAISENSVVYGMQYAKLCKLFSKDLVLITCEEFFKFLLNNPSDNKDTFVGTLRLLGCLFVVGVLQKKVIDKGILVPLLMKYHNSTEKINSKTLENNNNNNKVHTNKPSKINIEGVCELLKVIGRKLQRAHSSVLAKYLDFLETLKSHYEFRTQVLIEELMEFRDRNWQSLTTKGETEILSSEMKILGNSVSDKKKWRDYGMPNPPKPFRLSENASTTQSASDTPGSNMIHSANRHKYGRYQHQSNITSTDTGTNGGTDAGTPDGGNNTSNYTRFTSVPHYNNYNETPNGYSNNRVTPGYNHRGNRGNRGNRYYYYDMDNNQSTTNGQYFDDYNGCNDYNNGDRHQNDYYRGDNDGNNDRRYGQRRQNNHPPRYFDNKPRSNYRRDRRYATRDRPQSHHSHIRRNTSSNNSNSNHTRGGGGNHRRNRIINAPVANKVAATFVRDITLPDRGEHAIDTALIKTWRMKNSGNIEWGNNMELVFFKGQEEMITARRISVRNVMPGEEIDLSVTVRTPSAPGRYCAYYRLQNSGKFVGPRVWVDLIAVIPEPDQQPMRTIQCR